MINIESVEGFRLSPQQKRLWFLQQNDAAYRAQCAISIEGLLDTSLLEAAVGHVINRHEILQTTFRYQPGIRTPVQVIAGSRSFSEQTHPSLLFSWRREDLSELDEEKQVVRSRELFEQQRKLPFDFAHGPLVRLSLLCLGTHKHLCFITLPALCADSLTLKYLYEELCSTYKSLLRGEVFTAEPMQYADFAEWQNELAESETAKAGRDYWQEHSRSCLLSGAIPFEHRQRPAPEFEPARLVRTHTSPLARQIEGLARKYHTHVAIVLQACWQTLLWRQTRQSEIVVGRVFDGRNYDELKGAFGLMARCVPMSCSFKHDPSFEEVLLEVSRNAHEVDQWQECWTWNSLAQPTQSQAAAAELAVQSNYFALSFEYQDRCGSYAVGGLEFSIWDQFVCFDRYKLKLVGVGDDRDDKLCTEFHYDPQHISPEAVSCLAGQFQQVIESVLHNPQARVSELRLLSHEERRRLLVELNQTEQEYDRHKLIQQLFEEQAANVPDRDAVVYEGDQLSYEKLNARANQLAHYLRERGVGPETPVLLNVERSLEMMIGLLGILKAGGAYVPLDGPQPKHRLAAILEETSSPVVVTQASLKAYFAESGRQLFCIDSDWETISDRSVENPCRVANGDNLVYVIYTSGSTGKPKGVAIEQRQLTNYFYAINQRIRTPRQGSYTTVSTFAADLGNTMIYLALCNGGTLHIIPQQRATDAAALADYFSRREMDCLKIVPSHLEALLAHDRPEALLPRKCLLVGGEAAGHKLINRVRELAPQCEIYNHYGPTETTVGVLTSQARESGRAPAATTLPIGRPLGNTEVYVLDQQMEPVATGETGEVYLGGAQVARGYIYQPKLTAERFWPNPFGKRRGERLYRTGDLGRFSPDGAVEFMGRADSQVKLHGHRIELGEIRCVLNQHPQISDSVVLISKDNNAQDVMIAYYTARESIAVDQLRVFLAEYLTAQVTPNFFIHLTKFPLTPNGKIDLQALSRIDREGSPRAFIAPRTPMEERLAGLWTSLLGVKQISTHDNFFTVGGHSLLATRIISQLSKSLQMDVPIEVLFESPTIAAMAERLQALVQAGKGLQTAPIVRVPRDRKLPLSFAQERLWFVDQLEPGSSGYHSTSALRLAGPLDLIALQKTLDEIIQRHEVLRTTFKLLDGTPVQVVSSGYPIELPVVQLSDLPETERDAEALRFANEDSVKPFNLAVGPLLRVTLLRLDHEKHVLVVTMHHIISDAWSNGVLMREVSALYDAFIHNRPSPLAELLVQYADFASWQRQLFETDGLEAHLTFWRARLGNHLPMLEIPSDQPRPKVRTFRGGKHSLNFSRSLAEGLRTLSRRNEVTLFMTMLAAFQILMRFLTKQDDIVVGTDVANRNRTETEGLIGFFINQLVLKANLSGNPSFSELLCRVREVVLEAYAHQDLPFNKLVEALRPERSLTYSPFFQVKFGFENTPTTLLEMTGLTITPLELESIGAKLDFTVLLHETRDGISGWVEYNRDLFEPRTVARIAEYFETLLGEIVSRPEARLGELEKLLAVLESRRVECEQKERAEAQRKKFRSIKPQAITMAEEGLVKAEYLGPGEKLPLILRPAHDSIELADWAGANRDLIETELRKHGAILFRGFDIGSSARFEHFAATLSPDLFNENGEHPRQSISGNVYTPVFYPADQKLLWHNENSFNNRWPMKIWFYCVKPANHGGETILADSQKVFEALEPRIREQFIQKKVMYVRNYQKGLGLDWQAVFQTTDKGEVERRCLQDGMEVEWKSGDRLCTRCVRPAAAKHPRTGTWVWFNQAQHWHISRLDAETRRSLVSLFAESDLPRNCYYGDGTAIEDSVMDEICSVYLKLEVSFPWKAGDIMMLDNMLTAHGRNPFVGERKLCVALGEMLRYDEL